MRLPRLFTFCALVFFAVVEAKKGTSGGSKACSHTGFYTKKVVPLCESHFPEASSKHLWVVQFYHPYVKKVHEGQAAYEGLAAGTDKIDGAKVGAVDCKENQEFCAKQGIREAPTTRVLMQGNVREFEGVVSVENLQAFVKETVQRFKDMEAALDCNVKGIFKDPKIDSTIPLCTKTFPPSLEPVPWIVSFYDSGDRNKDKAMKNTMNKLADKYGNNPPKKVDAKKKTLRMRFGAIECGHADNDCESLGVNTYPTIRFYRAGADPVDFESFFDKDEVKQFAEAQLKAMPKVEAAALQADMPEAKEEL